MVYVSSNVIASGTTSTPAVAAFKSIFECASSAVHRQSVIGAFGKKCQRISDVALTVDVECGGRSCGADADLGSFLENHGVHDVAGGVPHRNLGTHPFSGDIRFH